MFGAELFNDNGFLEISPQKKVAMLKSYAMTAMSLNQNSEVVSWKTKTISWKKLKSSTELPGTAESDDDSLIAILESV